MKRLGQSSKKRWGAQFIQEKNIFYRYYFNYLKL